MDKKEDLLSDYQFEGAMNRRFKKLSMKVAASIPELAYIDEKDFNVIIAKLPPKKKQGLMIIAEMIYTGHGWEIQYIEHLMKGTLSPYIMMIYPIFFNRPREQKLKTIIHELFHIKPNKRGIRPHIGFGDEPVYKMYEKNLRKLTRV